MRDELGIQPTLSSADCERIRRCRETLVTRGLLSAPPGGSAVAQHIENSWRRCIGDDLPAAGAEIDYREPGEGLPALQRAAEPVLERLKDSFAELPMAMVLSDATGRIVRRYAALRHQRAIMDRACAAEGFDFSEQSIGTNGIGMVVLERRPVVVRGPEHYNTLLEQLTCASTPIVAPYTGRLVGSFSLACTVRDAHPLMTVLAGDIGRQIEARIVEEAGERHRKLVRGYLSLERAHGAVLVVDEESVLANRLGLVHTGPETHALLWTFLDEHRPARPQRMWVPFSDGPHEAWVEPIHEGGKAAYGVRVLSVRPGQPPDSPSTGDLPALGSGTSPALREPLHFLDDLDRQLETAVRHREMLAVTGASGTGKLRTALCVLRRLGADDPLVVEPQLDSAWFDAARTAVAQGRGLVLRRVHASPSPSVAQVQALAAGGVPVVLTADPDAADDAAMGLIGQVATTVRLPELAHIRAHLSSLVGVMLAELAEPESATRFAPAVWQLLLSWHWPGNLAELRNTVVLLARRAGGGTVEAGDLPEKLRTARRSVGLMESAQRQAVAAALRAAGGNRSRAAQALGLGRNTLYRKMREFGIT
jgi:hypothetical protein